MSQNYIQDTTCPIPSRLRCDARATVRTLRLADEERDAFLKRHKSVLCEQHGRVLKEYVEVPDALLKKTKMLQKVFEASLSYTRSLKPKPTKKKKKKSSR